MLKSSFTGFPSRQLFELPSLTLWMFIYQFPIYHFPEVNTAHFTPGLPICYPCRSYRVNPLESNYMVIWQSSPSPLLPPARALMEDAYALTSQIAQVALPKSTCSCISSGSSFNVHVFILDFSSMLFSSGICWFFILITVEEWSSDLWRNGEAGSPQELRPHLHRAITIQLWIRNEILMDQAPV